MVKQIRLTVHYKEDLTELVSCLERLAFRDVNSQGIHATVFNDGSVGIETGDGRPILHDDVDLRFSEEGS